MTIDIPAIATRIAEDELGSRAMAKQGNGPVSPAADPDVTGSPTEQTLSVLVVDDDELIIDMIATGLPRFGLPTVTASSAAEARAQIAARRDIGVVVADLNMPSETGLALATELLRGRAEDEALEVILVTGHLRADDAISALRSHVADFISKPFGMRQLSDSIRRALESARRRRENAAYANRINTRMAEADDERRRLIATLNRANAELAASNRTRNDLIAMVSHELRTPLIPIIGFAETMRQSASVPVEDMRSWAATIEQSGRRLLAMINGALDIVALDQGKQPTRSNGIILEMLLNRVAASHRRLAAEYRVRIVVKAESGLLVDIDPRAMETAIGHLVDNAIRASPVAETVRVAAWASGNSVSIAVSDRGPGVAKSVMDQLGTPFLQGDLSYGRRWEGVGLGLALSTRIIRAHGGRLSLAPRLDGGTVAVIELPPRECDDATTRIAGARRLAHGLEAKDRDAIGSYAERDGSASACPALSA